MEDDRLRYREKKYKSLDGGPNEEMIWNPPEIIYRERVDDIQLNDHLFVKSKDCEWKRGKVVSCGVYNWMVERPTRGCVVKVKDLSDGKTETILLSSRDKDGNLKCDRIKFRDMRDIEVGLSFPQNRT